MAVATAAVKLLGGGCLSGHAAVEPKAGARAPPSRMSGLLCRRVDCV